MIEADFGGSCRLGSLRRHGSGSVTGSQVADPEAERASRRRFAVGSALGAVLALAVFTVTLANGRADLAVRETFGNFYDAQAKALLDGHWNVRASELFIEGFRIGDKTQTYFGIWPSVLRMPVLAFGDTYYGRLTQLSMVLAAAVALGGLGALHWRIRSLVRPGRPCSRAEAAIAAAVMVTFGCGTTVIFLASRAWVYHEAILWGIAWSIASYERIIAFITEPRRGRLVAASIFAMLAFLSRAPVGIGPVVALALVLVGQLLRALRQWLARRGRNPESAPLRALGRLDWLGVAKGSNGRRWILGCFIAVLVPLAVYGWMNWSRFDTLFSVPWRNQVLVGIDLRHQRVLDANGGSYFGLSYAPTTLLQALRPDALGLSPLFPFVTFPRFETLVLGNPAFDTLDWSTSIPASMPAVALLGAVGLWATIKSSYARTRAVAALRAPMLGAAAGVVLVLTIAFVANRYLGDWLPLLVIGALAGLQVLLRRREDATRRRAASVLLALAALLAVFGLWTNTSLAFMYQRLYSPHWDAQRAGMLGLQYDIDGWFGGAPRDARFVSDLPERPVSAGTTVVVGDCAAVYWSDGRHWRPVEGAPAGGWFRFRVEPARDVGADWQPLVAWGPAGRENVVGLRRRGDRVDFGLAQPTASGIHWFRSRQLLRVPRPEFVVEMHVDRPLRDILVTVDDHFAGGFGNVRGLLPDGPFRVGRARTSGAAKRFAGRLEPLPARGTLCSRLEDRRSG